MQQTAPISTNHLKRTFTHPSPCPPIILVFTPMHNQTALCPAPPYGPSMMMPACCCRDLTRYGCSEQRERAAAVPGGQRNTGPFHARVALPWAAAPLGPWGTRAEQGRRAHSPQPSSWSHSSWKWGNVKVEIVDFWSCILQSEALRNGMALQGHVCYWVWRLKPDGDHIVKSWRCQQIELNPSVSRKQGKDMC